MALALSCAPQVSPDTLAAIARVESSFNPLAVHDNTSGHSYSPTDKGDAVGLTRQLLRAGHSVDAGMMQVNSANFSWTGLTIEEAFEPCSSIRAGAAVLTSVSKYNTGNPTAGFRNGYVKKVVDAHQSLKMAGVPTVSASNASTDAGTVKPLPHDWDVFPDETGEMQQPEPAPTMDATETGSGTAPDPNKIVSSKESQ